jgi:Flp pilus assembly protein TadD
MMTISNLRCSLSKPLRYTLWILFFFEAQVTAYAQSSPAPAGQSKSTKLANPLNELLDEAKRDIDKNDFEAAIAPLQRVIAEEPNTAYAHFQLAYVFTALKRVDEARAEYERTIAIDPKLAEAYLDLGILLLDKEPRAAVAPLTKAVELRPAESRPRFLLGVAEERSGDLGKAFDFFEGAVRLEPRDFETIEHLGGLYLQLKRPADAEAKFRGALELQPTDARALLGLAQSLDAQKKPEAAEAFQKYLAVQPSDTAARARLVHLLMDGQEYDAALAELDRADAGKPPSMDSLKLRADIQITQKKYDDAAATLSRAIALSPNDAQLHGGLGRLYLQKRDFASAEKELKIALRMEPNNLFY